MVKGYKCKECGYETLARGWHLAQNDIRDHFAENHPTIIQSIQEQQEKIDKEVELIESKYRLDSFSNHVETIESTPAKKWTCPDCGEEFYYGRDKFFHIANRKTHCKPRFKKEVA